MTNGCILKQSNPQKLLNDYNSQTLEEVFLQLCYQAISENTSEENIRQPRNQTIDKTKANINSRENISKDFNVNHKNDSIDYQRVYAMLWKYYILTLRRPLFLCMFYLVPIIALMAMKLSIGQNPYNIPLAVYNGDSKQTLSRLFLESIDKNYIHLTEYSDNKTAHNSVVDGTNYMSIVFKERFSQSFEKRIENLLEMKAQDLDQSEIKLSADLSNTALIIYIFKYFFDAFERFSQKMSKTFGYVLKKSL